MNDHLTCRAVLVIFATDLAFHAGRIEPSDSFRLGLHRGPLPEQTREQLGLENGGKVFDA